LRATTAPDAASPASPARPSSFHAFISLPRRRKATYYDPGSFWSSDGLEVELGDEISVELPPQEP
jgi:hypothetical protein